jgi:hypothetical protein
MSLFIMIREKKANESQTPNIKTQVSKEREDSKAKRPSNMSL